MHAVFLDGGYHHDGEEVSFHPLPRLSTHDVIAVLEDACARMTRHLRRRGLLDEEDADASAAADDGGEANGLAELARATVSGDRPPAGPVWRRGALPSVRSSPDFERHLSVGRGGFKLHAATRAGAGPTSSSLRDARAVVTGPGPSL